MVLGRSVATAEAVILNVALGREFEDLPDFWKHQDETPAKPPGCGCDEGDSADECLSYLRRHATLLWTTRLGFRICHGHALWIQCRAQISRGKRDLDRPVAPVEFVPPVWTVYAISLNSGDSVFDSTPSKLLLFAAT
jgi:hypothetical protein